MKKQTIILAAVAFILLIVLVLSSALLRNKKEPETVAPTIVPTKSVYPDFISSTPYPTDVNPLSITSVVPENRARGVGLKERIVITFSRAFSTDEVTFSLAPFVPFEQSIEDNKLVVTPKGVFSPGVPYAYTIHFKNKSKLPESYTFWSIGPTVTRFPDTQPTGAAEEEEKNTREVRPDLYLARKVPYTGEGFEVLKTFVKGNPGYFSFKVIISGTDRELARKKFSEWVLALGFSQEEFGKLEIKYE